MLNGVCAGLVEGIAGGDVSVDFFVVVGAHNHVCRGNGGDGTPQSAFEEGNAGVDLVGAVAQSPEHGPGLVRTGRFVQHLAVQGHGRIRSDDQQIFRRGGRHSLRLEPGGFDHVYGRIWVSDAFLVNVGDLDADGPSWKPDQCPAPGGSRGKDDLTHESLREKGRLRDWPAFLVRKGSM